MVTVPERDGGEIAGRRGWQMVKKFLRLEAMRRSLVLTDDAARHPFLASLPPHVRRGAEPVPARRPRLSLHDLRDFLTAYSACFVAVSLFIA